MSGNKKRMAPQPPTSGSRNSMTVAPPDPPTSPDTAPTSSSIPSTPTSPEPMNDAHISAHGSSQTMSSKTEAISQRETKVPLEQSKNNLSSKENAPDVANQVLSAESLQISETVGAELVELVRRNTELSYDKSHVAVETVLSHLKHRIPQFTPVMDDILHNMVKTKRASPTLAVSQDAERLQVLFRELEACKDDSQQRSWFLHEDEHVIGGHLQELISILNNANPEICKEVIAQESYSCIHTLVLYYQMETRVSLRLLLLQVFGGLCGVEAKAISELLQSVLPLELARDMQSDTQDIQKLQYSGLVLTMLFSMGEDLPIHHYNQLNADFVRYLLEHIESPPLSDEDDQVPDLFVKLLLAFNLHFQLPSENMVMKVLAASGTAKTFTEKLILLVNRQVDPVRIFDHQPQPADSVLKFLTDLYSSPSTSNLLYTNDAMVLLDIVLRQLSDLSANDKVRKEYLSLLHLIVTNSDYTDHHYRRVELAACLLRISNEEDKESEMDRRIVKQIWTEFPQLFQH